MAVNEKATAQIFLDGKQAEAAIDALKTKGDELRRKIIEAAKAGDEVNLTKWKKELAGVEAAEKSLTREAFSVQKVLDNLSTASLHDVGRALNQANKELSRMKQNDPGLEAQKQKVLQLRGAYTDLKTELSSTGGFIGKLTNKFESIPGPVGIAAQGIGGLVKGMWALVANPIGATIAAIVGSVMLLYKAFKSTDDGATKLEGVFKGLNNILDVLMDRVVSYGKMLWDIATLDFEGIKKNGKDAFGGLAKQIAETAASGYDYAQTMDDIEDREVAASNRMTKLRVEIEQLKNTAKDRTKTDRERMEAAQSAMDKEIELNKLETKFLNEKTEAEIKNLASKLNNSKMTAADKEAQLKRWLEIDDLQLASMLENDAAFADFYNKNSEAFQGLQKQKSEELMKEAELAQGTRRLQSELSGFKKELAAENANANEEAAKKALETLEKQQAKELNAIKQTQLEKNQTEEEYNKILQDQQLKSLTEKLALEQKYKLDTSATEAAILDIKLKQQQDFNKKSADEKKKTNEKELSDLDIQLKTELAKIKQQGLEQGLTDDEINGILLNKQLDFLNQKVVLLKRNGEDTAAIEAEIAAKSVEITDNALKIAGASEKQRADLKNKYLEDNLTNEQQKAAALLKLEKAYNTESLRQTEEYKQLQKAITEKYEKDKFEIAEKYLQAADQLLSMLMDASNARKAKELKQAGDDAAKKEAIEKKYAKQQQKIQIGQAIAAGAMAILQIWKGTTTGEPISDTIIKGIMSAIVAGKTAAEITTIKNQQLYTGGFTGGTQKYKPAGIVHEDEFVANQDSTHNPTIRPILEYIDFAQKNGTARSINLPAAVISTYSAPMPGYASGGFAPGTTSVSGSSSTTIIQQQSDPEMKILLQQNAELLSHLKQNGVKTNINTQEIFKSQSDYENGISTSQFK